MKPRERDDDVITVSMFSLCLSRDLELMNRWIFICGCSSVRGRQTKNNRLATNVNLMERGEESRILKVNSCLF